MLKLHEVSRLPQPLRVYDLCSGSGCIALLFWHRYWTLATEQLLKVPYVRITGAEASPEACRLAHQNRDLMLHQRNKPQRTMDRLIHGKWLTDSLNQLSFVRVNVLRRQNSSKELQSLQTLQERIQGSTKNGATECYHIWISNPPYISPTSFESRTNQSVRNFEPKKALVPPLTHTTKANVAPRSGDEGDRFHEDILDQAMEFRPEIVLLEVEDMAQATRVVQLAVQQKHWAVIEVWRDEPSSRQEPQEIVKVKGVTIPVVGSGEGRSVLVCTQKGAYWLGRGSNPKDALRRGRGQQAKKGQPPQRTTERWREKVAKAKAKAEAKRRGKSGNALLESKAAP